jgi:FO synthase
MASSQMALLDAAKHGELPDDVAALGLAECADTRALVEAAGLIRDRGYPRLVTYSKKVFIPLTHLCRDVCHYCTFAQTPKRIDAAYLPLDKVL